MASATSTVADPAGAAAKRVPEPCTVLILGAAGDLARRKLLPSLFHLYRGQHIPDAMLFVGLDKAELTEEDFKTGVKKGHTRSMGLQTQMLPKANEWDDFLARLHFVKADATSEKALKELAKTLLTLEAKHGLPKRRVIYLALPPSIVGKTLKTLEAAGLIGRETRGKPGEWARVVLEKPFGRDLDTARELNAVTQAILAENETFRIDHYLGKETVQNILFFRFANALFEPLWNHNYIDHVQITATETIGCDGRAGVYEETGALRDMVQNHLLQMLALVAMEPPVTAEAESIREEKVKVLKALRPVSPAGAARETVRAQYGGGKIGRQMVEGYLEELNRFNSDRKLEALKSSRTETFAALRVYVDNWRWAGTPFYLRSGKRLAKPLTEVAIHFKPAPHSIFRRQQLQPQPNLLLLQIQPNESITLTIETKIPGSDAAPKTVNMAFKYPDAFTSENPNAYERLLQDCMLGDLSLFIRSDEVEQAWAFITPILQGWAAQPEAGLPTYAAGSWGPACADEWLKADGRTWHNV